ITPDRGKEFAQHRLVTEALGVEFYFPEPHQPWTRGTNENTNGLLREYFPKHQDINQWSEVDIQQVINKLNLRPRKCLGWKTPYEVYFKKSLHLV
ncbi:TPA: IS30 family transposase, partial [Escherichia coli]|nr:IS30 family transposase [Escherichia coli]HCE4117116.1 IS30 family transposase [Escherichia coli]